MDKKEILETLEKLIRLMSKEKELPRDLQLTFEEIHDYIIRNM
jgi:hypothetical protein